MKLYRFDAGTGRAITQFGSRGLGFTRIVHAAERLSVAVMHLEPGGEVGYHPAVTPQLFMVVHGDGWVQGPRPEPRQPIAAGQAAFWAAGEWHAAGTDSNLTAVVLEGESLEPGGDLKLIE